MRTSNMEAGIFVQQRIPFKGHNLSGIVVRPGVYAVLSYDWYYLFICKSNPYPKDGESEQPVWYENSRKYSVSTSKQTTQARPGETIPVYGNDKMRELL